MTNLLMNPTIVRNNLGPAAPARPRGESGGKFFAGNVNSSRPNLR